MKDPKTPPVTLEDIRSSVATVARVLAEAVGSEPHPTNRTLMLQAYRHLMRAHTCLLTARTPQPPTG